MSFSIIAHDEKTGQTGIAMAGKYFAIGARNHFVRAGVGAIATQAYFNPHHGPRGLALLATGASAADVVRLLMAVDEDRDRRQLHVMDRQHRFAAHTGKACHDWCGQAIKPGLSLAGNLLAGPEVLVEMSVAYGKAAELPFAQRLIAALKGGERAGGDKRGRQSAALLIYGQEEYALADIRVDDHRDPLTELERLEQVSQQA